MKRQSKNQVKNKKGSREVSLKYNLNLINNNYILYNIYKLKVGDTMKQQKYGLFTTIAMIVGIVIGSGIFFK